MYDHGTSDHWCSWVPAVDSEKQQEEDCHEFLLLPDLECPEYFVLGYLEYPVGWLRTPCKQAQSPRVPKVNWKAESSK